MPLGRQTSPSVQAVRLVGSWDGFRQPYVMDRDSRRSGGQWRGCHSFSNIICDGEARVPKRDGGLKMGRTYYYYVSMPAWPR